MNIPFVLSMDVHPSRELVASGQRAGRERKSQAHVRIWSTESLQTLYVFGMGELDAGVSSVAFSQLVSRVCASNRTENNNHKFFAFRQNGGSYILAVDGGRESILSVWQWQWGHLLGKVAVIIRIFELKQTNKCDDGVWVCVFSIYIYYSFFRLCPRCRRCKKASLAPPFTRSTII